MSAQIAVLAIQIGLILLLSKLFGMLAAKCKIPSVMGELVAGILLGPYSLGHLGIPLPGFENGLFPMPAVLNPGDIPVDPKLYGIAILGSIILLFLSGLETDVRTFFKYSVVGTVVGIGGIVCSFLCGALVGMLALHWPFMDPRCLFLGILCTATSVGISARILSEHHAMSSPEGVTIMAAAVIDDVLGIVCLAIVVGIANAELKGETMSWGPIIRITIKSFAIWLGVTALGLFLSRQIASFLKFFKSTRIFSVLAFGLALILAGFFEKVGLAMIVGAFVMGLSLSKTDIAFKVRSALMPLYNFLVPIFFVVMGMLVDVRVLKDPEVLKVGLIFSFMAIVGKVVGCSLPSFLMNFNSVGALRIGIGMIPRCEVVLIIAGIAATTMMKNPDLKTAGTAAIQQAGNTAPILTQVPIFDSKLFGIAIIMPLITALLAPPLLGMVLAIKRKGVRKEIKDSNDNETKFTFPSYSITTFVVNEIIELLTHDGFMHSTYTKGINLIQFRKEDISFSLEIKGNDFTFISSPDQVPFINMTVYESVVELHQSLSELKKLVTPEKLKDEIYGNQEPIAQTAPVEPKSKSRAIPLNKLLTGNNIIVNLKGQTKEDIIRELIDTVHRNTPLADIEACYHDVLEREKIVSTYQGEEIAMPHARTNGASTFGAAIGILPQGINYDIGEQHVAKIFILSLCPKDEPGPYLQFISQVSQVLSKPQKRDELINAKTSLEAWQTFIG